MKLTPTAKLLFSLLVLLATAMTFAQDQRYYLYGGGQFTVGEPVQLTTWLDGMPATDLTLFEVANPEELLALGGPGEFSLTDGLELNEIASREVIQESPNESTTIDLGELPIGLYLAQLGPTDTGSATLLLVTDLALVTKWDGSNLLVYAADLGTGEPVDATITLAGSDGPEQLATEPGGLTVVPRAAAVGNDDSVPLAANLGESWAFSTAAWYRWSADIPDIYLVTDRPVYRPGHSVFIKGTARLSRSVAALAGEQVTVTIEDANYDELLTDTVITDEYGSFALELDLPAGAPLGYYSITAQLAGSNSWGSFRVEEYTKPEYDVAVDALVDWAIQGETADFTVSAEYLFGGPVGGATVDYVVLSEPYSPWAWRSQYGFYDTYSSTYGGEVIARGQATLGANGQLTLPVELQRQEHDYRLTLQASVSDESGADISGSASLIAYRADLVLGVQAERYAHPLGEEIQLTITAQDLEGNPVATDFTLTTERHYWDTRQREEIVVPGQDLSGSTDASGSTTITIAPDESGSWRITASASDAQGRVTDSIESLWVYGGEASYRDYPYLDITVDKEEYEVGDTARFVVDSPVADGWALVTAEGGALYDWRIIRFEGTTFTVEQAVTDRDLPDSNIGVVVVGNGAIYQSTASYRIDPGSRFLNVELSSTGDTFEPGTSTEMEVNVTDQDGNPVQAQLTVGMVDEAIYLVRPDQTQDIRGFFYGTHGNSVWTDLSSYVYFGQVEPVGMAREAMDEAVFAQAKSSADAAQSQAQAPAELREDFRDTILWLPTVETDADGHATVQVDFPDNLTSWRLTVRAITLGGLVGQETHTVTTTLPVIARLAMPAQLIQGDEARLRLIGQNNLEETLLGRFSLEADGLTLTSPAATGTGIELPAGGRATADWLARADEVGATTVRAEVTTTEASDALQLPLEVQPRAIPGELVWADAGDSQWLIRFPDGTLDGSASGSLLLTPTLTAAVSPALNWLIGLEYGYTELTMSRLLATVMTSEAGLPLPEDVGDIDELVSDGLNDLYALQHPDGGWGFGRFDVSNPAISAFVTSGLLELQDAGFEVRSWVLDDSLDFLEAASAKDSYQIYEGIQDPVARRRAIADAKSLMGLVLAQAGRTVPEHDALPVQADLSNHGLAASVLALAELNRTTEANLYLDELLSRMTGGASSAHWESGGVRYTWSDDEVETTALGLRALIKLRPESDAIPGIVNWLLLARNGNHWLSSKSTLAVMRVALELEAVVGAVPVEPQTVTVLLNGVVIAEEQLGREQVEVPLNGLVVSGRNLLEIHAGSRDLPYVSADVTFMFGDDFEAPVDDGIGAERTYELLTPVWREAEQHYEYERGPLEGVRVGDFVVATVTLTPHDMLRFVQLFEPVPAGFSVVEDDYSFRLAGIPRRYGEDYWGWNYWYDAREIRDGGIDYWFGQLDEPVTFTYILRAEHPGSFTALPSQARLLYERDVAGRSAAERLSIME